MRFDDPVGDTGVPGSEVPRSAQFLVQTHMLESEVRKVSGPVRSPVVGTCVRGPDGPWSDPGRRDGRAGRGHQGTRWSVNQIQVGSPGVTTRVGFLGPRFW